MDFRTPDLPCPSDGSSRGQVHEVETSNGEDRGRDEDECPQVFRIALTYARGQAVDTVGKVLLHVETHPEESLQAESFSGLVRVREDRRCETR